MTPILADRVNNSRAGIISQDELDRCRAELKAFFWDDAPVAVKQFVIMGCKGMPASVAEAKFTELTQRQTIEIALSATRLLEAVARLGYIWP